MRPQDWWFALTIVLLPCAGAQDAAKNDLELFQGNWSLISAQNDGTAMPQEEAKKLKRQINTIWIYPPPPTRAAALASADPERVIDL